MGHQTHRANTGNNKNVLKIILGILLYEDFVLSINPHKCRLRQ